MEVRLQFQPQGGQLCLNNQMVWLEGRQTTERIQPWTKGSLTQLQVSRREIGPEHEMVDSSTSDQVWEELGGVDLLLGEAERSSQPTQGSQGAASLVESIPEGEQETIQTEPEKREKSKRLPQWSPMDPLALNSQ